LVLQICLRLHLRHIMPLGTMVTCPTTVDLDNEDDVASSLACMERGRSIQQFDVPRDSLSTSFDVENLLVGRPDGGPEMEVTLLTKKNSGSVKDDFADVSSWWRLHGTGGEEHALAPNLHGNVETGR